MPYLELVPKKTEKVQLNLRVPVALKASLERLRDVWTGILEAQSMDASHVDLTWVCIRLLTVGEEGAWAELGRNVAPESEAEVRAVIKSAVAALKK